MVVLQKLHEHIRILWILLGKMRDSSLDLLKQVQCVASVQPLRCRPSLTCITQQCKRNSQASLEAG